MLGMSRTFDRFATGGKGPNVQPDVVDLCAVSPSVTLTSNTDLRRNCTVYLALVTA